VIPRSPAAAQAQREIVTRAQILRVSHVAVKPTPRPRPTSAISIIPSPVHRVRVIAATVEGRKGGPQAPAIQPRTAAATQYGAKPVWDVARGSTAQLAAAQTGNAAGSGTATGSASGAGTTGTGDSVATGTEPCGFVEFSDPHGSAFDARTRGFYVDIRMRVHFADGTSQSLVLDYPWYYTSEADNPWSDRNLRDPNFPTRFQPPPQSRLESEPELVRYVIAHSTADGMTLLRDCPSPVP
jgi:hypothetical protein